MQRKVFVTLAFVLIASLVLAACGTPTATTQPTTAAGATKPATAGSIQITGSGATFPLPVYTEWTYAYAYVDPSVVINYQGVGSGGGKKAIVDNTVDFAGSDSLVTDAEYTSGKDLQMYPMLAGAVVPIYNIEGWKTGDPIVVLDRDTLAKIYLGEIKNWNDAAILKTNPDLAAKLPNKPITTVHRSDGSGTTEIFTKALAAFSADWKSKAGAGSAIEWPTDKAGTGIGGKGNQGVAAAVQNTPNSIGYVELSFAVANNINYASMVNKAGKTVKAENASTQAAMTDFAAAFDAKLTTNIVDAPGEKSWPIAGYTYLILHTKNMTDCVKAQKLLEYINWSLTDAGANKRAIDLGYSPLPEAVRKSVQAKLLEVTCKDKPVLNK